VENLSGIRTRRLGQHLWLISLYGEHDLAGDDDLRLAMAEVFAAGSTLVVDLTHATFVDTSVVSALLDAHEVATGEAGDELVVIARRGSPPRRVLDLAGVDSVIGVYDDRSAALAATDGSSTGELTERQRRLAYNEVLFRRANDQIEDHAWSQGIDDEVAFFCECSDRDCVERIYATIAEYERAHESPTRFLLLPGHEQPRIEHVTDRSERYVVVEKDGPVGEFVAAELG